MGSKCKYLLDILSPVQGQNTHAAMIYHHVGGTITITYKDLHEASDKVKNAIQSLAKDVNIVAAIAILEHHYLVPLAILGILKSYGSFLYLDINLGKKEQEDLLEAAKCTHLISDFKHGLSGWSETANINISKFMNCNVTVSHNQSMGNFYKTVEEDWKEAYVIRTSGSTGQHKIVHVPHTCILPNILDLREQFQIRESDVILGCSPFTFDPSIVDIFLSFSSGATLVLVDPPLKTMPLKLVNIIEQEHVTVLQATPSLLLLFGSQLSKNCLLSETTTLRILALGGEAFPSPHILREYYSPTNTTDIFNLYGITEVSCWASVSIFDKKDDGELHLGRPLKGTEFRVVNEEGQEINGGIGYLLVGGSRVCLLGDEKPEDLSAPVFRNTGDMVRYENGKLFYLGRTDDVTKRLGQRLNLREVEITALKSGMTSQCCAFLDENQRLILLCKELGSAALLIKHFKDVSPPIEQPNEILQVQEIPLSKHGKIDRKKALELYQKMKYPIENEVDLEVLLENGWIEATGKEIYPKANFIMSGGNSLSAIELANRIQRRSGCAFPSLLDILINRTSQEVIDYLNKESMINGTQNSGIQNSGILIYHRHAHPPSHCTTNVAVVIYLKLLWKFRLNKCIDASPLVINRHGRAAVYIGSHSHLFSSIQLENGLEIWTRELPDRIESSAACDPDGSSVLVGCYDGHLYCLDADTGSIRWKFLTGDAIKSSPICVGSTVIFGSHDKSLYCVSTTNGSLIWSTKISSGSLFASPTWDQRNCILIASLDGTCSAVDLLSGEAVWSFKLDKPVFSSPVYLAGSKRCLFACVGGTLNCCDVATGKLLWTFKAQGPIFSTPSVCENRVVFGSHDHSMYCIDSENGNQIWQVIFSSPVYSSPFAGSFVICSDTSGVLRVLNAEDGKIMSESRLPGETFSSPVMVDSLILIGCRDDFLYCFKVARKEDTTST